MKSLQNYITNISALQFIQLLRFSTLVIISLVFVRYCSKTEIGEYEMLLFVASAVSFYWLRGVLQVLLSLVGSEKEKSNSYFNAFLLMLFFSLLTIIFLTIFKHSIEKFIINNNQIPYFKWLLLYVFFSTPSYLIEYIFLGTNNPMKIFKYGIISYGIQFIALTLPVFLGLTIESSIIGLVIVNGLRFLYLIKTLYTYSKFEISTVFIKEHIKLAYPLIGSSLLSGSSQYIDGAIITHFFDNATFAVFRYGAREFPLVIILANALSHAMIPEFTKLTYTEALKKLKTNAIRLMHLLFPIVLILIITSNLIFPIAFTSQFALSAKIFNVYLLLVIARLLFPDTILIGRRYTTILLWVSFAEVTINVALSIVFVQIWGLVGVAVATVIANLIERVILIIIVKIKYQTRLIDYISIKWYAIYSICTLAVYYVVDYKIFIT